ncbi:hypothetical protein N9937_02080 [bacterium]|nr:hypothetical protein [bacterium]
MKAILEFTLPEENPEFIEASNASELANMVSDIDQYCRGIIKHGDPSDETYSKLRQIRDMITDVRHLII